MNRTNRHPSHADAIRHLRALCPDRPIDDTTARSIAERQATRLLKLTHTDAPMVDAAIVADLPRVDVSTIAGLPSSGATTWRRGRWLIQLNADDHILRRRFSLAHELKHILDHPSIDRLYQSEEDAERICDYFAACLLMPRPWIKRAFSSGIQNIAELAELFGVSRPAMTIRLQQLGLVEAPERCRTRPTQYERRRPARTPIGVIG